MRSAALLLLLILLGCPGAEARTKAVLSLDPDAQAGISVGCCFNSLDLLGYAPVDVTINNHSGQPRQWTFSFTSPAYAGGSASTMQSRFTVTVENNGTRTASLMVPTAPASVQSARMTIRVDVTGYGAEGNVSQILGGQAWSGKQETPFVAISESLGTSIWSTLSSQVDSQGDDLMGSTFNPDDLPEDWRGLSGVGALWLTGDELDRISAAQRNAIQTWVHAGGWLVLCNAAAVPPDFRVPGFGHVIQMTAPLNLEKVREIILNRLPREDDLSAIRKAPYTDLGAVRPNVPLLSGFMALFAVVIGPVNIFVLTRRRRERLFWTTPLISVCASALLMGMIVLQDGAGGHGVRNAVEFVFPESRSAVVKQEQVSRTGLLLSSAFQTRDPVCIRQLAVNADGSIQQAAPLVYGQQGRELRNEGTAYAGGWFVSRAAQAQHITAVMPTREEITLLNAADVHTGAAPQIVSSFAGTLDTLVYTDDSSNTWEAKEVRTGQKQTLERVPRKTRFANPYYSPGEAIQYFSQAPGYFVATSNDGRDSYVASLGSIRWTDEPVTYAGPVTTP